MVTRNHYRAQFLKNCPENEKTEALENCKIQVERLILEQKIMTAALYYYENMLFLYYEGLAEDIEPNHFMKGLDACLESWPQDGKVCKWAKMYHIYYHSIPKSEEEWKRKIPPERRRGRIARLRQDTMFEYVYHHAAIVNEGLLTGDKYQSIALHEDILFSYFEEPKKMVNIKEDYEHESEAIKAWTAVNPEAHFIPYEEAKGANFLLLPDYFNLG